ncbi:MAG: TrkH family potassium uptake protein [Hyphomicrobiales bacterium]
MDLRPPVTAASSLLLLLALCLLLTAGVDALGEGPDAVLFCVCAAAAIFLGVGLRLVARSDGGRSFGARELPLFATGTAILLTLFAAAPLALGSAKMPFAAAIFEAASGLMTNGASALVSPDDTAKGLLFWRALLQFLGGGLFVALMICLLPHGQGQADGFWMLGGPNWEASRLRRLGPRVLGVYAALTALCAIAYFAAGMSAFDAVAHAFSTLSTGGFSTHAGSFSFFGEPDLQWIAIVFMLLAALPLGTVAMLFKGELQPLLRHREIQLFLGVALVLVVIAWTHLALAGIESGWVGLRHAAFDVVSRITTTGFEAGEPGKRGDFHVLLLIAAALIGGCTGSAAGGLRPIRLAVLIQGMRRSFIRFVHPNAAVPFTHGGRRLQEEAVTTVFAFAVIYVAAFAALSLALVLAGLRAGPALTGAIMALTNAGPAFGAGLSAGDYAHLPAAAHWVLAGGMIVGRLEVVMAVVLFLPGYWRR